ncbi:MAG: hypothetical protein ACOCTS_00470, partial [Thermodesulfobacteriota bacterium]
PEQLSKDRVKLWNSLKNYRKMNAPVSSLTKVYFLFPQLLIGVDGEQLDGFALDFILSVWISRSCLYEKDRSDYQAL